MIFDKTLCLNNIRYLAKSKGINLGDLETGAGVSAGYLSRIGKEDNKSSPSIEVLSSIADKLGVSLDSLIGYDYAGMAPTERYVIAFIEKLASETLKGVQDWDKETSVTFSQINSFPDGSTSHPLFKVDGQSVSYNSHFASVVGTKPGGEIYHTQLTDGTSLYLAKVVYPNVSGVDYEAYIVSYDYQSDSWCVEPVCATNPANETVFDEALARLYNIAKDSCRNVKVNQAVRNAIDSFMRPPFEDDDGELPF